MAHHRAISFSFRTPWLTNCDQASFDLLIRKSLLSWWLMKFVKP